MPKNFNQKTPTELDRQLKIFTFFDKKRGKLDLNRLNRTLLGIQNLIL